ncbi:MAG: hypothetical protein C0483_06410 [Pirellula sp.]|nr:hypothetical protein [Pirellula sp.]
MPHRAVRPTLPLRTFLVCLLLSGNLDPACANDDAGVELYEKKVRPALVEHCVKCHGPEKQEGGLQVDSVAAMLRGGDQGPALMPGDPDASLLIQGIRYDDINFQMPPKGKMPSDVVKALEEWVRAGAPAPSSEQKTPGASAVKKFDLAERAKHWCFQPLAKTKPPVVGNRAWPRGDVDRFVLQKLEEAKLRPAPQAEPHEIIRRLSFDLIGLPPTAADVASFVAEFTAAKDDTARDKVYGALVDRLLASPHFGERWARHWLDLVRYAESRGHEFDYLIPNAFQYRDYVIRALNADVPYDRFVVEHLAGDLLAEPRRHPQTGGNESILGTGFWFLGEECHSPVDIRQDETDRIDNKIDVMSKTFLGLTLACARCHDHKFDALSTKDYYAMSGFVLGMSYRQSAFEVAEHNRRIAEQIRILDARHEAAVRQAQWELWQPTLAIVDRYLLAAREVHIKSSRDDTASAKVSAVRAAALKHGLEESRLQAWIDYLQSPATQDDVFARWREFMRSGKIPEAKELESSAASRTFAPRIIVDYGNISARDWLEEGLVFGGRARRAGELCIGDDLQRPLSRVETDSAAVADLRMDPPSDHPSEGEPGKIQWRQAGRTLKTPTFTLNTGKLRYLIRGSGHIFASVASHRMINGPLHGSLVRDFPTDGDGYRWVEHDLSAYVGQRMHVEFSPYELDDLKEGQSSELAIGGVIELPDSTQPMPEWNFESVDQRRAEERALWFILQEVTSLKSGDVPAHVLAELYKSVLTKSARSVLHGDGPPKWIEARIVNEMLKHGTLWNAPSPKPATQIADYFSRRAELLKQLKPNATTAPAAWEGSAVDEYVLVRGNHRTVGELVPRRFLEAIDGESPDAYRTTGGRLALAERLVDRSDPLPARVMVNRLWQHLFGAGLVRTVDNFGSMGELPTHPELLDHLARKFMDQGWSVKSMLRELAMSQTYRMSSRAAERSVTDADPAIADPENKLLHRARVKRLEAEIVRDAMLAVSGRLDAQLYGPSIGVYITPFMDGRGKPQSGPLDGMGRRSIYLKVRRNFLNPMFQAFDYPTPFTSVGRRSVSNVPQQALALMNGLLPAELAKQWAGSTLKDTALSSADDRIRRLYHAAFAREPSADELAAGQEFLRDQQKLYEAATPDDPRVWTDYCQVLLNTKEFIFIP